MATTGPNDGTASCAGSKRVASRGVAAMLIAATVLALVNSAALPRYVADLPSSPPTEEALLLAERWHEVMQRLGLASFETHVREAMTALQARRFTENAPR